MVVFNAFSYTTTTKFTQGTKVNTLAEMKGHILDLDSHIQPSPKTYEHVAGEVGRRFHSMYEMIANLEPAQAERLARWTGEEATEWNDQTV